MSNRWEQVERLFAQALALEPAARSAFLDAACGAGDAVRLEVDALLRADAACSTDDFLLDPISAAVEQFGGTAELSRVGQQVGPYRLTGELGHGGMGRVYLAERVDRQYRAEVAIKFVQGGFGSPDLIARFRAERQILADLGHPNIARLLDGGSTTDGTPFLVMERIVGQPIDRYCDERRLGIRDRLELFLQVCSAVQYAHQALIVHRDLKPSNIMVTEAGEPKLLDFGIAKLLDPTAGEEETTLLRALTPAYASPEQVRGARATVAADVYSLGVVLYRVLVGREPFQLRGLSPAEVERVLTEVEPERPSQAVVAEGDGPGPAARALLRGDLDTIVLRALGKTPLERYPSVAAFADDVRRHLEGRPVLARPATLRYRAGRFLHRYRREVAVGLVALGSLVALTTWYLRRVATERDKARLEAAKAAEVAGFLQGLFEVSDPSRARGNSITARELLDLAAARIEADLAGQPEVQATMMRVIGSVYGSLGLSEHGKPLLERSVARHRGLYRDPHAEIATTELALGITLQDLGDFNGARPLLEHAVAARTVLFGREDSLVTESQGHLAFLLETIGEYAAAESLRTEVLRVTRRRYPTGHLAIAHAVVRLGGLLRRLDRREEAEPLLREGLAAEQAAYGERHLDVASTQRNLAALLRDRGKYAEAESLYRVVLATRRVLLGELHPEVATALNSFALLLQAKGDSLGAVSAFEEFVRIIEQTYTEPHPSLAAGYNNLGYALIDVGRYADAEASFRRSMTVQDRVYARDHAHRAHPLMGLAAIRVRQQRFSAAEPLLRQAVRIRRGALSPGHREIGDALSELGRNLTALRRYAGAESALVEAYRIFESADGADGRSTRRTAERLSALYDAWGRPDQAVRYNLHVPADSAVTIP